MKKCKRLLICLATTLSLLSFGGVMSNTNVAQAKRNPDLIYTNPLEKWSTASKDMEKGTLPRGQKLTIYDRKSYTTLDDNDHKYTTTNGFKILGSDAYFFPLTSNPSGRISVVYYHAIKYHGKDANVKVTFDLRHFQGAYGQHYLAISRNFADGIFYHGFEAGRVKITAFHGNADKPTNISLDNDWISIDSLNGVGKGYKPKPDKDLYSLNGGSYGEWANYMNMSADPNNSDYAYNPVGFTQYERRHNIGKIHAKGVNTFDGTGLVNGGVPDKTFADYVSGTGDLPNGRKSTIRSFYKNSIWFCLGQDDVNTFDFGSGSSQHSAWFKVSSHSFPFSKKPKYYCKPEKLTKKQLSKIKDAKTKKAIEMNHDTILKHNLKVGTKRPLKYSLLDGHKYGKHMSKHTYNKIVSTKSHKVTKKGLSYWMNHVAKCLVNPSNRLVCKVTKNNKLALYLGNKKIDSSLVNNKTVKQLTSLGIPVEQAKELVGISNTSPKKINVGKRTAKGWKHFTVNATDYDKSDISTWEKNNGCIIHHHRKVIKIMKKTITPTSTTPIKYLGSGITHVRYDSDTDEGVLRAPQQEYWYHITGLMPERNYYNTYFPGIATQYAYIRGYWYDGYPDDKYHITDNLPKDVSVVGTPVLNIDGDQIQDDGSGNTVDFTLNATQMDDYSQQQYTADIHVKANNLPKPTTAGWLKYMNGGDGKQDKSTSTEAWGSDEIQRHLYAPSNKVPVKIKKIEDNTYYYDYNHSENKKNNFFPESELATGLSNNCGSTVTDPNDPNYKPYQFNKYFAGGRVSDNKGKADKTHSVLAVKHHIGYVGSVFGAQSIDQNKDGDPNWHYRTVYPTFSKPNLPELDYDNYKDTLNGKYPNGLFSQEEQMLGSNQGLKSADNPSSSDEYVPIIMTPSACGSNYLDDSKADGFTENTYLPYLVPRITFLPDNSKEQSRNGQLIVDTDTDKHGLPFRFNMRSMNFLYDKDYYYKDFAHDKITMRIKSGNDTNTTIYKSTRPLIGKASNNKALSRRGYHAIKRDEYPAGDDGQWHGYIEKHALNHAWSDYAKDYNSKHGTNLTGSQMRHRYALNIQKAYSPSDVKARQDDNNYSLPIRVTFTLTNPSRDQITFEKLNGMESHAYTAADPQIQNGSFGNNDVIKQGSRHNSSNGDANRATFIAPERTIKYYENNNNCDEDADVRELNELLSVNQPRKAIGKTGFGMTGNDLGITYLGHLEAAQYAHTGTNMRYAFPHDFASHNTKMHYDSDRRHTSLLGDTMMHIQPKDIPTDSDGLGENDNLPKELDTDDVTNDNSNEGQADDYYQAKFPQELHAGNFSTTYGFYPREATHNIRTNQDGGGNTPENNGGDITVAKNSSEASDYHSHHKAYGDPVITKDYGNPLDKERGYGMNGVNTYNNDNSFTHHTISIKDNGENEAMFTPYFMSNGTYPTFFERVFYHSRAHRLGGNFIDIDEGRPVKFYAHMMISKDSNSTDNDEFSMQPILSNTRHGLSQTPYSSPLFPDDWLSGADDKMSPNWFDALIKTNGHSKDLGEHDKYDDVHFDNDNSSKTKSKSNNNDKKSSKSSNKPSKSSKSSNKK